MPRSTPPEYTQTPTEIRWKNRVLKDADPATFEILGDQYARDTKQVYFKDRLVRLKSKAGGSRSEFRQIGPSMGTDGAWLYFGTTMVEPPPAVRDGSLDLATATYLPFHNTAGHAKAINLDDGLLSDGQCHWVRAWPDYWFEVPTAAVLPIEPDHAEFGHGRYFTDGTFYTYRGANFPGPESGEARAIAPGAIDVVGRLYIGGREAPGYDATSVTWIAGDLLHTGATILRIDPAKGSIIEEQPTAPTVTLLYAIQTFLKAMLPRVASVCDRYLPVTCPPDEMDFDVPPPGGVIDFSVLNATPDRIRLSVASQGIEALPGAWYELCCSAWAATRGEPDRMVPYVSFGTMLPGTDSLSTALLKAAQPEALTLASALYAAGAHEDATLLAHHVLVGIWRSGDPPMALAQHLAPGLEHAARYSRVQDTFTVTTNLAVTKLIAKEGWLANPDPRVRLEMINLLTGAVLEAKNGKRALALAVPAIITQLATETNSALRTALEIALDAMTVKATVMGDLQQPRADEWLEQAARYLIDRHVNVHINRVRLIEALTAQGRDEEAASIEEALLTEAPADNPCPGPYVHREIFPNFAAAAAAARARAVSS